MDKEDGKDTAGLGDEREGGREGERERERTEKVQWLAMN